MGPFSKMLESGPPEPQGLIPLVQYTECRNGAQTGLTIIYHFLPATVRCHRDSLSVTDSGTVEETYDTIEEINVDSKAEYTA